MQANKFERQNRYVEKLKAEGLKRFQFWMKPEEKEYLMQVLDNLRNGKSIDIKEKWRAVYLKGLGAFPVVWSIIFALTRYVDGDMALKQPKRRKINLLEYDFELLIKSIVGRAAMRAEDSWKGTPLGFITYPLRVESRLVPANIINEFPKGILTVVVDPAGKLKATNANCDNIEQITAWRITPPVMTDADRRQGWNPYMLALAELFKD